MKEETEMSDEKKKSDVLDLLVGAVVGTAGVLTSSVYVSAWLAAKITAPREFTPHFGDGLWAIYGIFAHRSNPRLAWPPEYREALPGPWLYWLIQGVVATLCSAGAGVLLWRWLKGAPTLDGRNRLGVNTQDGEAKKKDLRHLLLKEPDPHRLVVGRFKGRWVSLESKRQSGRKAKRSSGRGAVAHIGPSQCGKTTNVVNGVNGYVGPMILFSVKDDALMQTLPARKKLGEIKTFDPTGVTGRANASWSPLRAAASRQGALKAASSLSSTAPESGNSNKGDFWNMQAQSLVTALLLVAANNDDMTMSDVVRWITTRDMPTDKNPGEVAPLLRVMRAEAKGSKRADIDFANDLLQGIWKGDERTTTSIYATARSMVWAWTDPVVARWSQHTDVDLAWLLEGNNTLYISTPPTDQKRVAPVVSGLLADIVDQLFAHNVATGKPLDVSLLLVIDEAAAAKLQDLAEWAATLAGLGVLLVTVWQSEAQITAIYGEQAGAIMTNHTTKIHYPGMSDTKGLETLSALAGSEHLPGRLSSSRTSGAEASPTLVALAPLSLLRRLKPGTAAMVSATLPVALIDVSYKPSRIEWLKGRLARRSTPPPVVPEVKRRAPAPPGSFGNIE